MERPDLQALCRLRPDDEQPRSNVARSSRRLCTSCVQEGGFEGPENGPKQRRINNRLLSYRPKPKNNFKILAGERGPAQLQPLPTSLVYLHAISSHAKIIFYLNGNGDIV